MMIDLEQLRDPHYRGQVIDELALHNPTVRRCLDLWRSGACDRATAMELAVIYLAEESERLSGELTGKIARAPMIAAYPRLTLDLNTPGFIYVKVNESNVQVDSRIDFEQVFDRLPASSYDHYEYQEWEHFFLRLAAKARDKAQG